MHSKVGTICGVSILFLKCIYETLILKIVNLYFKNFNFFLKYKEHLDC